MFGSGVQGVVYYAKMPIHYDVPLSSIPQSSDRVEAYRTTDGAYRTTDGAYDPSSFYAYQAISYDSDGNYQVANTYISRITSSPASSLAVYAGTQDKSYFTGSFLQEFDNGVFLHWLVRMDCARDDGCGAYNRAFQNSPHAVSPHVVLRNKNPFD